MTINYKAKDRKPLVDAVSKFTGEKAVYQKVPTYAYKIGCYTVTKEGNLECDESISGEEITKLMEFLSQNGYTAPQTAVKAANKTAEKLSTKLKASRRTQLWGLRFRCRGVISRRMVLITSKGLSTASQTLSKRRWVLMNCPSK